MTGPRYEQPGAFTRADAERAFAEHAGEGADVVTLANAILGAALSVDDAPWLRERLAAFLAHASPTIRGAAARGLGHVARLHGGDAKELRALLEPLLKDAATRGAARDALDDVDIFAS